MNNMTIILLLGPLLEEQYGGTAIVGAVVVGFGFSPKKQSSIFT